MSRTAETVLTLTAAVLAAFGVSLVNFAAGGGVDAQPALTFLVFAMAFGGFLAAIRAWATRAPTFLVPLAAVLAALGFVVIYRLDPNLATLQRWWLLVGAGSASLLLYGLRSGGLEILRRRSLLLATVGTGLLLLPFLPTTGPLPLHGLTINGSRLWVEWNAGLMFRIQPGDAARLLLVVFLASYLADNQTLLRDATRKTGFLRIPETRQLAVLVVGGAICWGLLSYQGDPGAAVLLFGGYVLMLYMASDRLSYPATGLGLFGAGLAIAFIVSPQLRERITTWLNPWSIYEEAGFPVAQGLFALGSGHLSGSGLGLGRPDLLPSATTDYVFAALAEEVGLAGSVAVIASFGLLAAAGFGIAIRSRDPFRKLLAAGLSLVLGLQTFLVLAGILRLLPVTSLPTPFMSYGILTLPVGFLLIALLARISHEERR